jgi:putative restriction endonuclease
MPLEEDPQAVKPWQDGAVPSAEVLTADEVLERLGALRQHQHEGKRSPHKPLLLLLALSELAASGTSTIAWSRAERQLANLIADFGPPSRTARAQSAAYPFTRLRSDGVWILDHEVPMDRVRPLSEQQVVGRLEESLETTLRRDQAILASAARMLVESEFPITVAPDVLLAVGLDPDVILGTAADGEIPRRRNATWPAMILAAWDRQCAFCGFDGQLGGAPVGIEAAHVRWFNFAGPDTVDNGLALCALHHKLFDRGALGLDDDLRIKVSTEFSTRTGVGRLLYDLHGRPLRPRPGTTMPAAEHVDWHNHEVFKGDPLAA